MKLSRPVIALDTETTGVDPINDRIIEIGLIFYSPAGKMGRFEQRFNPGIPIPPGATEVHHITDADVKDCPAFSVFAKRILSTLDGKDLIGYNLRALDLPIIDSEMRRCGLKLDLAGIHVIDAFGLYRKTDPRKLEDYVRQYCGREPSGSHGAGNDAADTLDGLFGQLKANPELDSMSMEELAVYSNLGDKVPVDISGKLYRDADGDVCYSFGKNKDRKVKDDFGYYKWVMDNDFPGNTKDVLRAEADRLRKERAGA